MKEEFLLNVIYCRAIFAKFDLRISTTLFDKVKILEEINRRLNKKQYKTKMFGILASAKKKKDVPVRELR